MTEIISPQLFEVVNSNFNRMLILAPDKEYANGIARLEGHLRDEKNGIIQSVDLDELAASKPKFASSVKRAIQAGAAGPVIDSDGFALVYRQVFMPLSAV